MEESERLCWELLQQESMEAFNMQLEFIRENSAAMDSADLQALQQAMQEERAAHEMMVRLAQSNAVRRHASGDETQEEDEEEEEGTEAQEEEANQEDDSGNWTYDRLLALGEALGGIISMPNTIRHVY